MIHTTRKQLCKNALLCSFTAVTGNNAEHMGANLLLCNAAARLQAQATERRSQKEGSNPTHGKGNHVLHPKPLSEKGGMGSPAKTREDNRVPFTSKEVGLA